MVSKFDLVEMLGTHSGSWLNSRSLIYDENLGYGKILIVDGIMVNSSSYYFLSWVSAVELTMQFPEFDWCQQYIV